MDNLVVDGVVVNDANGNLASEGDYQKGMTERDGIMSARGLLATDDKNNLVARVDVDDAPALGVKLAERHAVVNDNNEVVEVADNTAG